MKFQEILEYAEKGEKIRREDWRNEKFYIHFSREYEFFLDFAERKISLSLEDYKADDWEIYKDKKVKYFDWNKAYELMKEGKKVRRKKWNKLDTESIFIKDNFFLKKYDEHYGFYTVHDLTPEDLEAKDWYLVGEE